SSARSSANSSAPPVFLRRPDTAVSHPFCVCRNAPEKMPAPASIPLHLDFLPTLCESALARPILHSSRPDPSEALRASSLATSRSRCSPNPVSNRSASHPDQKPALVPSIHLFLS